MKMITKAVSVVLTMALLMSVAVCAPFSAGAAEKDSAVQGDNTPKPAESCSVDFDSAVEIEDTQPAGDPAAEPKDGKAEEEPLGAEDEAEPVAAEETVSGDFSYIEVDGKVYISCYNGEDTEVTFPAQIDGKDVYGISVNGRNNCIPKNNITKAVVSEGIKEITTDAFYSCTALTQIDLPESLITIGSFAFSLSGLKAITIPGSVSNIGTNVFSGCQSFQTVNIDEGVTSLSERAFSFCLNLSEVNLPEGLISIGYNAFDYCSKLTRIDFPESLTTIDNYAFAYCGLNSVNFPSNLSTIGNGAFQQSGLKSVTIPGSVANLGSSVFSSCESLQTVNIEKGIKSLPSNTFSSCKALTEVNLPDGLATIGDSVFASCKGLSQIDFPESLTSIGNRAFSSSGLTSVNFTSNITAVGEYAFSHTAIESLTITKGLTNIGGWAFSYCDNLKNVYFEDGVTKVSSIAFAYCPSIKEVDLPDSITKVSDSAFYTCTGLERITFPENLEYIGENAFINCYSLKEITIPESTEIETHAFGGSGLTKVNWEKTNQKVIKKNTFANCSGLKEFTVPYGIETIDSYAFYNTGLKSIVLPESLVTIGERAFSNCKSLEQINLPESLTTLSQDAFSGCKSLKEISIPDKIKLINYGVFMNCESLTDVYAHDNLYFSYNNVESYWGRYNYDSFENCANVTIHCGSKYSATARNAVNHNYAFDFKFIDREADPTSIIDMENSSYYINSGAAKSLVCNYAFKDEVYQGAEDKNVLIRMPLGMEIVPGQFYVDGKKTTDFKFDTTSRVYTIPVSNQSGRIVMYIANEDNGYNLRTYAALKCKTNGKTVTETIDLYNEFVGAMAISSDETTSDGSVKVTGSGPKSTTVNIYADNTLCGTANTNKVGSFSAEISIPNPVNTMTYAITAKAANASGKEVKATAYTQYVKSAPKLTGFWMIPKDGRLGLTAIDLLNPNGKIRLGATAINHSYFAMQFENAEDIKEVILSSTKDGKTANYSIRWDEKQKMFVSGTTLLDYDRNQEFAIPAVMGSPGEIIWTPNLPGRLSIAIETKPVEPEINYNWGVAMAEKAKSIAAENDYIVSTNVKSQTENSVNVDINTKDGTVNSRIDKGSAGDFINNHPDIAGYTGNGTIHGGLSDFTNTAIPGTEASVNPNIADVGKNMTEGQLIDSVKNNWALTPTPDGNLYTNVSVNDNGVNYCTFNPVSGQFALNAMAFSSNFVGLAAGRSASPFISGVTGAAGVAIGIGATLYQNINYMNNQKSLGDALYQQIMNSIDDPVQQQLARNAWLKMNMLAGLGALAAIGGDSLIALGFAAFWMNPWIGLGMIGVGIGMNLFAGWLNENSNEEYHKVLMYLYGKTPFSFIIDPSGYVYAGLESNRIQGATATVYGIIKDDDIDDETFWDEPDESREVKWDAEEYDQINPQITDYYGFYQWDVPIGWWRVEIEADGYETYTTEWMQVPPPQVDVNIGLTATKAPAIISADEEDDGYTITFEDCMKPESLKSITLTDKKGRAVDCALEYTAETSPDGIELAKTVKLVFDVNSGSTDKFNLSIANTENYSGITGDVSFTLKPNRNPLDTVTSSLPDDSALRRGETVTLSNSNIDAVIYYTTDGSDPSDDENSSRQIYSEPIIINEDTTVKTCATARGFNESEISSFTYYIADGTIGDVNHDGIVDILDAMAIQKNAVNKLSFNAVERFLADVNNDGTVDILDAVDIQKFTVEKLTAFEKA